jgi:hypothetical protein
MPAVPGKPLPLPSPASRERELPQRRSLFKTKRRLNTPIDILILHLYHIYQGSSPRRNIARNRDGEFTDFANDGDAGFPRNGEKEKQYGW